MEDGRALGYMSDLHLEFEERGPDQPTGTWFALQKAQRALAADEHPQVRPPLADLREDIDLLVIAGNTTPLTSRSTRKAKHGWERRSAAFASLSLPGDSCCHTPCTQLTERSPGPPARSAMLAYVRPGSRDGYLKACCVDSWASTAIGRTLLEVSRFSAPPGDMSAVRSTRTPINLEPSLDRPEKQAIWIEEMPAEFVDPLRESYPSSE